MMLDLSMQYAFLSGCPHTTLTLSLRCPYTARTLSLHCISVCKTYGIIGDGQRSKTKTPGRLPRYCSPTSHGHEASLIHELFPSCTSYLSTSKELDLQRSLNICPFWMIVALSAPAPPINVKQSTALRWLADETNQMKGQVKW